MYINKILIIFSLFLTLALSNDQQYQSQRFLNEQNFQEKYQNLTRILNEGEEENGHGKENSIKFGGPHGTFLNIWWCVGVDIATISARHFRSKFYYIQLHMVFYWITMIATIVFSLMMIFQVKLFFQNIYYQSSVRSRLSADNQNYNWHYYLGVVLMPMAACKMVSGILCYHQIVKNTPTCKYYKGLLYFHKIGGYITIILAKSVAVLGSCIHSTEQFDFKLKNFFCSTFYIVIYGIILMIYIIFEIYYRVQNPKWVTRFGLIWDWFVWKLCCQTPIIHKHPEYNQILQELKNQQALDLVEKYPKLTFALYRDYLVDLTGIIHPAGTFMNYQVRGREISRFINGSYDIETYKGKSIHQHTKFAEQQIQRHIVGKIDTNSISLVKKNQLSAVNSEIKWLNQEKIAQCNEDSSIWKLVKKTEILHEIMVVEFSSDQHTVLNYLPGVEWLGRHMAITPAKNPYKERVYTNAIFATQNNVEVRNQLIEMFEKKMNNQEIENYQFHIQEISQTYPMMIKKYAGKGALSQFIHESKETEYLLTGPFGQGLGLTNQSNKTYYFLLGGTTIPLNDLCDILLKKCIYTVIMQKFGQEEANKFNPYNQNFDKMFGPNFKIVVILTLKDLNQFIGREISTKLLEICKIYSINIFDMIVRFSNISEEEKTKSPYTKHLTFRKNRFDKEFLLQNIKVNENFGKVFICGPHPFILDACSAITEHVGEKNLLIL